MSEMPQVLVAGNPNAGKTTLFNQLAGTRARTGNYPGVTVDRRTARVTLGQGEGAREVELIDVPGTYSLTASSPEEAIAVDAILGTITPEEASTKAVVVVADATSLARGLYLTLQVLECGFPTVLGLNMMDEARELGLAIDSAGLSEALGVPVVEMVARRREGMEALSDAILAVLDDDPPPPPALAWGPAVERAVERVAEAYADVPDPRRREAWARWALMSEIDGDDLELRPEVRAACRAARTESAEDLDVQLVAARYAEVDELVRRHVEGEGPRTARGDSLDRWLTHPVAGMLAFALVMLMVFEALFSWSEPLIGWVEEGIVFSQDFLRASMPAGLFTDLLVEGVVAGVGNVLVFVPQIALLFFLLGFLEDCGYLARVAFVIDRLMKGVGLHGKAFVPLLGGFACAVPAVMATRTLSDRKDRLVTMLALPLMSCSARLPVYVLVVATVFVHQGDVLGFLSVGAVALLAMYGLSLGATLGAAAILRRTVLKGPRPTLVLELPPYRWPLVRNLVASTWARVRTFLIDAGTVILALTIVLWALLTFPKDPAVTERFDAERAEVTASLAGEERTEALTAIDGAEASAQLERSAAGRLGKAIEPAIAPLGMDWRLGIGVIGAFAAREVFVSTLGIVFGVGDEVDEESETLREELRAAKWPDGRSLMTPLAGVALMVFFVFACQCMSTIAVVRRESGSWKWPILMVVYMTVLAYVAALAVFQVGSAMGWGV
ncbi:MAG: ferrous iron transport protein B [Sandaracinus sp.]|nr:ferrous iron transport protein B [Sandaracinus sp.]|tara:strand:+ start:394 stop:2571 length:2178 start_codon:yes stop_codon:yes gene_type:complete